MVSKCLLVLSQRSREQVKQQVKKYETENINNGGIFSCYFSGSSSSDKW